MKISLERILKIQKTTENKTKRYKRNSGNVRRDNNSDSHKVKEG